VAERTLTVRLRAVADEYNRVLDQAGRKAEHLAKQGDSITSWGKKAEGVGKKLTTHLTMPIVAVGAAALATASSYEASMREVQALTGGTASEMELLSGQAKKMGADTQFSATQAADAMSQLIKGGFGVTETYDALPGVMQLAAAATIEIADAADIATNVLSGFGLEVNELARVNDYLAQTANASDTDVRELGEAFKYVGPVAKGAGMSLQETTATLGLFAENGIRGSMAGTALRGAITALLNPTDKVANKLDELGVNAVTANGQLRPMNEIVDQLAKSGATTADIMQIFGQRAGPAMVALLAQGGGALRNFTGMLEDSRGVAQNLADSKMGGLSGAIEQLKGSLETLAITVGESGLLGFATGLAEGVVGIVNALTKVPKPAMQAGMAIAGIAAASGPAIWAFGKIATLYAPVVAGMGRVVGSFQALRVQMALARMDGIGAARALALSFGPQAAIVAGIAAIAGAMYLAHRNAKEFARSHMDAGDAALQLAESAGIATRELSGMSDETERGINSADDWRKANEDAIRTLRAIGDAVGQEAFLLEIGYQLTLRGASPEDAVEQVRRLAEAAGVEIPVDLNLENVDDFENQVAGAVERANRVFERGSKIANISNEMIADLDAIARAAADAWQTDNVAGFVEILAAAESQLGDNSIAYSYLADQALELIDVEGLSLLATNNLTSGIDELTSSVSGASAEQQELLNRIVEVASAMDGGLTPANLRVAAAAERARLEMEGAGGAASGAGDAAAGAAPGVGEMGEELDGAGDAAADAEKAFKEYLDTLRGATDPMFAMVDAFGRNQEAQWGVIEAQQKYNEAVAEHGASSLQAIEAQSKLNEAHLRAAQSARGVMIAAEEMRQAIEQGTMTVDSAKGMLDLWVQQGLITAETAARLKSQFDNTAAGAQAVADKTAVAKAALDQLDGTEATALITVVQRQIDVNQSGVPFSIGAIELARNQDLNGNGVIGRFAGGPVWPGQTFLVGEKGPELVQFSGQGTVIPAEQTSRMMASPSGRLTPAAPGMSDAAIVGELRQLAAKVDRFATAAAKGDTFNIAASRPAATAMEIVRRRRERDFLVGR
jgi:TP901 family phage tail tape measure protein